MGPSTSSDGRKVGLIAVMAREVKTIARSPFYVLFMFVFPILSAAVMWGIFASRVPRDMPVVVRDGDQSTLSRQVIRMTDASATIAVAATVQDAAEAARHLRQGRAYALIYLPAHMERDARRGQSPEISVYFNNQWLLCSGVILRALRGVTGTLSAGLDIRTRLMKGEHPAQAFERFEPIRLEAHPLFNPNLSYYQFLVPPAIVALLQVFVLMVTVRAVGAELRHGTAGGWLEAAGGRTWLALLGKLAPYTIAFVLLAFTTLAVLFRVGRVPNNSTPWVLASATVLYVLAYQSMGVFLIAVTANLRLANSVAGFYSGPAFAFAGITFPLIGIPPAVKVWSYSLPLTHYVHLYFEQAYRGCPAQTSASGLLVLLGFVLLPPLIYVPRMRQCIRNPKYWGRL